MGFFSDIGNYMNKRAEIANAEYERASHQDLYGICRILKGKSMMSSGVSGTMRALKEKAEDSEDRELQTIFIQAKRESILIACSVLAQELEKRGYLERDNDGRYQKTEEW